MSLNINKIETLRQAREGLAVIQTDAAKIEAHIGHTFGLKPRAFAKHVYAALDLPITVEGMASRFVAQHGTYVRYCPPLRAFQAYVFSTTKKGEWKPVVITNIVRLIEKTVQDTVIEAAILIAAKEVGIIQSIPVDHQSSILSLIRAIKKDQSQVGDISNALEVVLKRSLVDAYRPEREADDQRAAKKLTAARPPKVLDF